MSDIIIMTKSKNNPDIETDINLSILFDSIYITKPLINVIHRHDGLCTINTRLRHPNEWDMPIRTLYSGYAISPWKNSNIKPDTDLKTERLCY
jgi:hypothetical protein